MGFFDRLAAIFSGGNDSQTLKLKRLRQIAKAIKVNKYGKFYKPKTEDLCAPLGKFFWELYRVTGTAQFLLRNASKSAELKNICVAAFLNDKLKELDERLSEQAIEKLAAREGAGEELAESVKKDLALYVAGFDAALISNVDKCYNAIMAFLQFIAFDFYAVLKKFDSGISERNFSYQPGFQPVYGAELVEELKDFMELAAPLEVEQDWKIPLSLLKEYKDGIEMVNPAQWEKALRLLRGVSSSGVMELIIQHSGKDPVWQRVAKPLQEKIAAAYLAAKKTEAEEAIRKIQNDKRDAQISQIAVTVFGSHKVDRMQNYTDKASEVFTARGFDGFTQTRAMNYLRVYLIDFFKTEIKELCNLFLIRGVWTNPELSRQLSESFHILMEIADNVYSFDKALSESGEHGVRLKQALQKSNRNQGQAKYVRIILTTINNDAQRMINDTAAHLIVIGKNLKILLEDYQRSSPALFMNWKELETASETPLTARINAAIKKTYDFVQLLQFFTAPVREES
jgi:hypothetical protein